MAYRWTTASAAAFGALLFAVSAAPAGAADVTVGQGESIQAAVDAASPGDTITVSGRHRENVVITKDRITLRGVPRGPDRAVLRPPKQPAEACALGGPNDISGFCVLGQGNLATGEITRQVEGVKITGFKINAFSAFGIIAFGAKDATFRENLADHNGEYGITAFNSTGTRILFNRTRNDGEAGVYIGDSPNANASVIGNRSSGNTFGVLFRNAQHARFVGNRLNRNCAGIAVLADAPGPAGDAVVAGNRIGTNTRACPAGDEEPAISGAGVGIVGGHDVTVVANQIQRNTPSAPSPFAGGVVVVSGLGGTPPTGNVVQGNLIRFNRPFDIVWDGTGAGNLFDPNHCDTSSPAGICPSTG